MLNHETAFFSIPFPVNRLIWHKANSKFSHNKPYTSSDMFEAYSNDIRRSSERVPKIIRLYPDEYSCITFLLLQREQNDESP